MPFPIKAGYSAALLLLESFIICFSTAYWQPLRAAEHLLLCLPSCYSKGFRNRTVPNICDPFHQTAIKLNSLAYIYS
uniref:Putative ovule protein n=1 Tax=Solanum chacoense TaxID=4108 RepID=A0A0V0GPQ9_SOLCH